jgi:hypothetical protein
MGSLKCPSAFKKGGVARQTWMQVTRDAGALLTASDAVALEALCRACEDLDDLRRHRPKDVGSSAYRQHAGVEHRLRSSIVALVKLLGLTPTSRATCRAAPPVPDDDDEYFQASK